MNPQVTNSIKRAKDIWNRIRANYFVKLTCYMFRQLMRRAMRNSLLTVSIVLTFLWLFLNLRFVGFSKIGELVNAPNTLGDFYAGLFAPVAFIWLVVAVTLQRLELVEQRKQLIQNGNSLAIQAEELKLTVQEMTEQTAILKTALEMDVQSQRRKKIEEDWNIALNHLRENYPDGGIVKTGVTTGGRRQTVGRIELIDTINELHRRLDRKDHVGACRLIAKNLMTAVQQLRELPEGIEVQFDTNSELVAALRRLVSIAHDGRSEHSFGARWLAIFDFCISWEACLDEISRRVDQRSSQEPPTSRSV